ncbi:MAG TPA: 5'-nucleotidase C-terminal domain-containing protein [Oscillatoriaceae cyanobacterium]
MLKFLRTLACLPLLAAVAMPAAAAPKAPETLNVTVLGTTDIHGHIYPTDYFSKSEDAPFGLARVYTVVKQLRATHAHTLLVDSGDSLQGTPLTYWSARVAPAGDPNPMVTAYNFMHYDAFAVGNHEYNYGIPYIEKARREAHYPYLSANIFKHGTNQYVYKPYVFRYVGGAKIAIVGFTTPGVMIWDRHNVEGKQDFRNIVACAKKVIPEVKARGADAIVVIIHSGLGAPYEPTFDGYSASAGAPPENVSAALADACPEITAILMGHTHENIPKKVEHGVLLTEADKWGAHLAEVDLHFTREHGRWVVTSKDCRTIDTRHAKPDPELMAAVKSAHEATLGYVQSAIGTSTEAMTAKESLLHDTPIIDFINEVQCADTGAQLSAASVFNDAAAVPKGKVSVADIASLYVYDNTLTKVSITGKQLKDYLEASAKFYNDYKPGAPIFNDKVPSYNYDMISGVDYDVDVTKPVGQRIENLTYQGKPVTDGEKFSLALNSYRQNGGGGFTMLKDAPVQQAVPTGIRDLLIDYVQTHKVIDPKQFSHENWHLVPAGCVAADGQHYK